MKPILATTLSLLLAALSAAAQGLPKPEEVVSLRAEPVKLTLAPGGTATLKLNVRIIPGFHINSNKPLQEYLIPTEVFLPADSAFELVGASYPKAELKSFGFAPDEKLAVYEGRVEIGVRLRARPNAGKPGAPPGEHKLALGLRYQACNDEICLRPAQRQLTLRIEVRPNK